MCDVQEAAHHGRTSFGELGEHHLLPNLRIEVSEREGPPPSVGDVSLRNIDLFSDEAFRIAQGTDVGFVNNYNDVFGARSAANVGAMTLDQRVARLFAAMKPGSRMVTLHPLSALGTDRTRTNAMRAQRRLPASANASFFDVETLVLEPKARPWTGGAVEPVVSWGDGSIEIYLYTRCKQDAKFPCFLCFDRDCEGARNPTAAVNGPDDPLNEVCVYCNHRKPPTTRARK